MNASIVVCINATSKNLKIDGDPNWDDQEVRIDGDIIKSIYSLQPGESVGVSVKNEWTEEEAKKNHNMMGFMFSGENDNDENQNTFQTTIGRNREGLMSITDIDSFKPMTIKHHVIARTKWLVVVQFEDV